MKTGWSLQGEQQHGKQIPEETQGQWMGCKQRQNNWRFVLCGPRKVNVREEIGAFYNETTRNSRGDGKGDTKGNGPKSVSPSGESNELACSHCRRAVSKIFRMLSLAPTRMRPLQIQKWLLISDKCEHVHTSNAVVMKLLPFSCKKHQNFSVY